MDTLTQKIIQKLQPVLDVHACDLVDVEIKGKTNARIVNVYADKAGGISIQTCTQIARKLRDIFDEDENEFHLGDYRIEVSSPGIDRPLKKLNDFKRNIGKLIQFQLKDPSSSKIEGELIHIENDVLEIKLKDEKRFLPFEQIKFGKIQIQWKS